MKNMRFAVAGILLAAASSSFALEQSWYGKVGFGTSDMDISGSESGGFSLDDSTGFNLTLGYQWNSNIAFEGTYTDLGEASDKVSEQYGDLATWGFESQTSVKAAVSATTMSFGTVISTDTNQPLSGGFRAGVHFWEAELDTSYRVQETWMVFDGTGYITNSDQYGGSSSASDDGTDLYYGLVGTYRMGQWLVSLEHTVFQADDANPSMTSLSVGMQF